MERLNASQAGERSPRFGIQMFRGRSGTELGSLDAPPFQTPSLPPRSPRRIIPPRKNFAGAVMGLVACMAAAFCMPSLFGGSAYWDHNMRGNADYSQGDWNGAVDEYSKMIALDPTRQDGYSLRSMVYFKLHQYRLSSADDRMALKYNTVSEGRAVIYQSLAYSEDYDNAHSQAIRDFTEAIALDPSIPDRPGWTADAHDDTGDSHKGRMWAYYESGQYPLALVDCQALIARDPYPSSIAVRGKIYRKMGRYDLALTDFRTALRENPRLEFASDQLTELLGEMGDYRNAISAAEAAAQANPASSDCRSNIGWWQYRAGEMKQAISTDKQALKMGGRQPITLFNLGLSYASEGDWRNARPVLAQALHVSDTSERHAALVDFQRAVVHQPHTAALHQALVMLRTF